MEKVEAEHKLKRVGEFGYKEESSRECQKISFSDLRQPFWLFIVYGMSSITLKHIPERLHHDYKRRAQANRRSLQAEIIRTLEQAAGQSEDGDYVTIDSVAGMLKPRGKNVSIAAMKEAVDQELKRRWKHT